MKRSSYGRTKSILWRCLKNYEGKESIFLSGIKLEIKINPFFNQKRILYNSFIVKAIAFSVEETACLMHTFMF